MNFHIQVQFYSISYCIKIQYKENMNRENKRDDTHHQEKKDSLFRYAAQGASSSEKMSSSQELPRIDDHRHGNGSSHRKTLLELADSNHEKLLVGYSGNKMNNGLLHKPEIGESSHKFSHSSTKNLDKDKNVNSHGSSIQKTRPASKNSTPIIKSQQSFSPKLESIKHLKISNNMLSSYAKENGIEINDVKKLQWIRKNIIGFNTRYSSQLKLEVQSLYIDHTATNRPFQPVETMVQHSKLLIANPHTEFSRYGKFSTQLMHQSLDTLLKCFNTNEEEFVALPTGSGSTGAIEKALNVLQNIQWAKNARIFITPYEHHSNILPWVEFYEYLNVLDHDSYGNIDVKKAEQQIKQHVANQSIIISVSAASNVTSQITNLSAINRIIKKFRSQGYKNLIFAVDCAAFCCHHHLDLQKYDEVDFAFLSPHKNLGGCESCGILVARKSMLSRSKPTFPGGGTVRFVKGYSKQDVLYEIDPFSREIAGTPPFLGFYRAALSFELLTNVIGYDFIHHQQAKNTELFFRLIKQSNQILKKEGNDTFINIYGDKNLQNRANVVTFNFQYGSHFIQHSFASLLFTDVFGIQVRSGCFCAGPFGIELLHIDQQKAEKIEEQVEAGIMINKPGYLRLDLTFYLEDYEVEYIAAASLLIARYWRNFSKLYTICNDGQILLLPIFKKQIPDIYSLADLKKAESAIRRQSQVHNEKLSRRKKTLEFMMKRAQQIAKNPINFLKKVKAGCQFKIDEL